MRCEILARAFESYHGPFPHKENTELVQDFLKLDQELKLLKTLQGLNSVDSIVISTNRNSILIFSQSGELEIKTYRDAPEALRALFQLEKDQSGKDIVLVNSRYIRIVRFAFKNYFSDAQDFVSLVEEGCQILSGVITMVR